MFLCVASILTVTAPVFGGSRSPDDDPDVAPGVSVVAVGDGPVTSGARVAKEEYEKRAAQIALQIDDTAAASRENAALLYFQALLARREPDPATAEALNAVSRGGEPGDWVRVYLGRSLTTIELAHLASQMPQCHWGPMRAGEQQLDFNLGIPLRRLSRILDADARTLAADGHTRAALARCLTIRRLAHHTGADTYNLYSIAQSMHTMSLLAVAHVLSLRPSNDETLTWLKGRLATVPGTPFEPAQALRQWRDAELQFWRTRPKERPFTREMVLERIPDANDRKVLATLTDDQLLVIALQGEQRVPGLYGISAPPQLLERAQQACDEYLQSALQVMRADLSYQEKHAKLQEMVDSLEDRAADGDPIALLSDAPKVVELYHRLLVRNAVYDNLIAAAIETCLVEAKTGHLPQTLPSRLPQDLYTGKDFKYERTGKGFVLRFDPDNVSRIRIRQFEFEVQDSNARTP
jgi:hypothetical protein